MLILYIAIKKCILFFVIAIQFSVILIIATIIIIIIGYRLFLLYPSVVYSILQTCLARHWRCGKMSGRVALHSFPGHTTRIAITQRQRKEQKRKRRLWNERLDGSEINLAGAVRTESWGDEVIAWGWDGGVGGTHASAAVRL